MGGVSQRDMSVNFLRLPRALPGCEKDEVLIQRFLMEQRAKLADALGACESPMERTFAYALLSSGDKNGSFLDLVARKRAGRVAPIARGRGGALYSQFAVAIRGRDARLDFALITRDQKIAIEIDGHDVHSTKPQIERDNQRHRALSAMGWRSLRFSGSEVYQDAASLADELFVSIGFSPGVATAIQRGADKPPPATIRQQAATDDIHSQISAAESRGDIGEVNRLLTVVADRAKQRLLDDGGPSASRSAASVVR